VRIVGAPCYARRVGEIVNCVSYADGRRVADVPLETISDVLEVDGQFVWIGLHDPSEPLLRTVQGEFGLHDLAIEDALQAHQRPKLEEYGSGLFVVLRTAELGADHQLDFGETHLFVGPSYVVSIRHGSSRSYADVRTRVESAPQLLRKGPGFVLYALMDFVVDQYFPIVDALEDDLDALEAAIFAGHVSRTLTERIYNLKRELLRLKRAVSPLIEVCNRLVRYDVSLIHDDTRPYFRDVYDHVIRINETVDTVRELLSSALEANLSLISVGQNEVAKKLAGWAAILAVPTMVAGIYGMNFHYMPELDWRYGYPLVLAVTVAICVTLWTGFKRSGWL
jgi:magnesium transporter